jgi:hypothetical protein
MVPTCARSCLLRGDLDASTTRPCLNMFNTGRFSGGGGPGGGLRAALGAPGASSYGGGGSDINRLFVSIAATDVCLKNVSRAMRPISDLHVFQERGEFSQAIECCACAESRGYAPGCPRLRDEGPSSNATSARSYLWGRILGLLLAKSTCLYEV